MCWYSGVPSDPSPATFPQTPPHAELLVWRPEGEARVLRVGGHPGGPAPGLGPAGEPFLPCPAAVTSSPHPRDGQSLSWLTRSPCLWAGEPVFLHPFFVPPPPAALAQPLPCVTIPMGCSGLAQDSTVLWDLLTSGWGRALGIYSASRKGWEELPLVP